MYELKLILLSILISTSVFAQQDSPTISELQNTVTSLTSKVETLNEVNNKILKTVHLTIGLIVAVFLGVGIFNSISNRKLNEEKFNSYTSGLNEKIAQFEKHTNDSTFRIQEELKAKLSEFKKGVTELVSKKTSEVQESMSKSLDSQINNKLYRLEINIAKSKLITLKLEHERNPLKHKVEVLEYKLKKSGFRPVSYSSYVDDFNRIIEMCYLSLKIAIADRNIPVEVTQHLKLLNVFLENNSINAKMNDSLTNLIGTLSNSQYDFRDSIRAINGSIRRSSDIPLV